jgi:hypothetical protein
VYQTRGANVAQFEFDAYQQIVARITTEEVRQQLTEMQPVVDFFL